VFERLTPDQLEALSAAFQVLRFQPGEVVFAQGQPTQGMFVFVSGQALLTRSASANGQPVEQRLGMVGSGQYLNEAALNAPMIESATLRVVESSVILFLARGRLEQVLQAVPALQGNLRGHLDEQEQHVTQALFKGQRPTEIIVRAWRRHWWWWVRLTWIPFALFVALGVGGAVTLTTSGGLGIALLALAFVVGGGVLYYIYAEWKDDALILTSERLVKIHNNLLTFTKSLNEIPLERVLEVRSDIPMGSVSARLFKFGTVLIKTAGESGNLQVDMIPRPESVQAVIFAERDRFRQVIEQRSRSAVRADVERALGIANPGAAAQSGTPGASSAPGDVKRSGTQGLVFARTRFINEGGEVVYRKHFTVWLSHILLPSVLILAGVVLAITALLGSSALMSNVPALVALPAAAGIVLIGLLWFYWSDWDWRNDTVTINPQSITIIHKRPLWIQNQIDRISLTQIDNVISDVEGLVPNLLNRGDVRVFLVGAEKPKVIDSIYAPQEMHAEISRRQAELKNKQQQEQSKQQRDAIADYLRAYHETMQIQQAQQQYGTQPQPPAQAPAPSWNAQPPAQAPAPSWNAQPPAQAPAPSWNAQPPAQAPAPSWNAQPPAQPQSPPASAPFFDPRAGTMSAPPPPPPGRVIPRDGTRPPNVPRSRPNG
jgi:hypothetical protein